MRLSSWFSPVFHRLACKTLPESLVKGDAISAQPCILGQQDDALGAWSELLKYATGLSDVWTYLLAFFQPLQSCQFMAFSYLDSCEQDIVCSHKVFKHYQHWGETQLDTSYLAVSLKSMLAKAYHIRDTSFSVGIEAYGPQFEQWVFKRHPDLTFQEFAEQHALSYWRNLKFFNIPFVCQQKTRACLTLGFRVLTQPVQQSVSKIYHQRDMLAQLIWNFLLKQQLEAQLHLDPLTQLLTYHSALPLINELYERHELSMVGMILLDIHDLKGINQQWGVHTGDALLKYMASKIKQFCSGADLIIRYAGDAMLMVIPQKPGDDLGQMANLCAASIYDAHDMPETLCNIPLRLSVVYASRDKKSLLSPQQQLELMDQAMIWVKFKRQKNDALWLCQQLDQACPEQQKQLLDAVVFNVSQKVSSAALSEIRQSLLAWKPAKPLDTAGIHLPDAVSQNEQDQALLETIYSLAGALDAKDPYTQGHSQAVAKYAEILAKAIGLNPQEVEQVRMAALLHDIGKIGIPERILCKDGPLIGKEWALMKEHPVIGARQILAPVTSLAPILPMVECHHEHWDGKGYPYGLKGEDIPLGARIISIVDAFHGLTSDRAYRKALTFERAKEIMEQGAGQCWDPALLKLFFSLKKHKVNFY